METRNITIAMSPTPDIPGIMDERDAALGENIDSAMTFYLLCAGFAIAAIVFVIYRLRRR